MQHVDNTHPCAIRLTMHAECTDDSMCRCYSAFSHQSRSSIVAAQAYHYITPCRSFIIQTVHKNDLVIQSAVGRVKVNRGTCLALFLIRCNLTHPVGQMKQICDSSFKWMGPVTINAACWWCSLEGDSIVARRGWKCNVNRSGLWCWVAPSREGQSMLRCSQNVLDVIIKCK